MSSFNAIGFEWLHHFSGRWPVLDALGIFFGDWMSYILVAAFLLLVAYQPSARKRFYLFAEGALAVILARGIIATAIHFFYYHPRPFGVYNFVPLIAESGSSFPSGHAAWFFALAMVVWYVNRTWGIWFFIFATVMGIARIYAGVHWPLDIIVGALLGVISAWGIHAVLRASPARTTSARP